MDKKLLALCLQDPKNLIASIDRGITYEYFQNEETGTLFKVLKWFYDNYKQVPTYDAIIGAVKISTLTESMKAVVPAVFMEVSQMTVVEPIDFIFDYLTKEYKSREVKKLIRESIDDFTPDKIDNTISYIIQTCNTFKNIGVKNSSEGDYREDVTDRLKEYDKVKGKEIIGLRYGYSALDCATGGHNEGEMWVILGQKKAGKSTMMLNMANYVWKQGKNVVYFSAEVSKRVLQRRLDSINTGLSNSKIKRGMLTEDEEKQYKDKLSQLSQNTGSFEIIDRPGITTEEIQAKIQEIKNKMHIDLVVVDYIGIISLPWKENTNWERVGNVALTLRNIAGIEKVAMLTAHQMNQDDDVAHSQDVSRHLDLLLSIRVKDEDERALSPICTLEAEIKLSRDSGSAKFELEAEFDKMTIKDAYQINV